jgi:mannose-6-phosphate isomerase-like protein (cupin superfamily)
VNKVRRVVTGTSEGGKSIVAVDESLEAVTVAALPGYGWHRLWGFDTPSADRSQGIVQHGLSHFPPATGMRFTLFTVPPAATARPAPTREQRLELEAKLPGRAAHMESDQGGMHRTPTIDLVYVVRGTITLELDDGVTVDLAEGDAIVQRGTRHAWRNTSAQPCTMLVVLLGTEAREFAHE